MDRRRFLRSILTGAVGAAAFPAFAKVPVTDAEGLKLLTTAWKNAAGRPILVILAPDAGEWGNHGEPLGAWLNHGGDAVWQVLARTEVVCVRKRHVELFAGVVDWPADPWFAVIDTRAVPSTVTPIALTLPAFPRDGFEAVDIPADTPPDQRQAAWERAWRKQQADEDEAIDTQIAMIQAAVEVAIARFHVPAPDTEAIADSRARVLEKAPPGADWATGGGCGITIEGQDDNIMYGCGMGHVPAKARRFLYFYAQQ